MKVWIIQPGVAPYRIPLFKNINDADDIDLTVVLLCEQVPFQTWRIDYNSLPFKTKLAKGYNKIVKDERVVHDREVQFSFPIIGLMLKERPDVIVCSGFMFSTLLVYLVSRITRTRFVIWNEGTKYTDSGLSTMKYYLRKLMAGASSNFIIAGSLAKDYVKSLQPGDDKKYYLSCNCVNNKHFVMNNDDEVLSEYKQRLPSRYFLFVGRFIETKGIVEMMDAYRDLVNIDGMSDVGLVLLGEGRLQSYIEDYVSENNLKNVLIEGFVEQNKIQYYYSCASAFILMSLSDPNPLVIFEAMASGIPVVCSHRAGNAADFIVDGKNGFIIDPFNNNETVDKLVSTLTEIDYEEAKEVSNKLLETANYETSSNSFIDSIRSAFNS